MSKCFSPNCTDADTWCEMFLWDDAMGEPMNLDEAAVAEYPYGCTLLTEDGEASPWYKDPNLRPSNLDVLGPMSGSHQDISASFSVSDPPGLAESSSDGSNTPSSPGSPSSPRSAASPRSSSTSLRPDPLLTGAYSMASYYNDPVLVPTHGDYGLEDPYIEGFEIPASDPGVTLVIESIPQTKGTTKRSRRISDKNKVAGVRKTGGCIRCRYGKYSCTEMTPCEPCIAWTSKNAHAMTCCLRDVPSDVIGSENLWGITPASVTVPRMQTRQLESVKISFPVVGVLNHLGLGVQYSPETGEMYLYEEMLPRQADLESWAEQQMLLEWKYRPDGLFRSEMEKLVMAYARSQVSLGRQDLVRKVHTLNCMYRVWRCSQFFITFPTIVEPDTLPAKPHCQLQGIAKTFIRSAERAILKELDKSISKPLGSKSKDPDVGLWVSLWVLIFIYHDLWLFQPRLIEEQLVHATVIDKTRRLFTTLMVMLACNFRNQSPIVALRNDRAEMEKILGYDSQVFTCLREVERCQKGFHNEIWDKAASGDYLAELWKSVVIGAELHLDKRRSKNKGCR